MIKIWIETFKVQREPAPHKIRGDSISRFSSAVVTERKNPPNEKIWREIERFGAALHTSAYTVHRHLGIGSVRKIAKHANPFFAKFARVHSFGHFEKLALLKARTFSSLLKSARFEKHELLKSVR
jgi:hypothetical protein